MSEFSECPSCGIEHHADDSRCPACGYSFVAARDDAPACARHPDARSTGACQRCGTFFCAVCAGDSRGDGVLECSACSLKRLGDIDAEILSCHRRASVCFAVYGLLAPAAALLFGARDGRSVAIGLGIFITGPLVLFALVSLRKKGDAGFVYGFIALAAASLAMIGMAIGWQPALLLTLALPIYAVRMMNRYSALERDRWWIQKSGSVNRILAAEEALAGRERTG